MSPLLWLIVVNTLFLTFEKESIRAVTDADDVLVMRVGKDLSALSATIRRVGKIEWFNPSKTELFLFIRKHKVPNQEWKAMH